ncbi:MAG: ABC transporter substrate-binding protein [Candidatus Lambdaproteobacteria bacterium]|nr:ABC transporter substrate-binding protein [Candidatus Lambdaproteobacteria bacterium]
MSPLRMAMAVAAALCLTALPATAQKYGGTLQVLISGNPNSLNIHDEPPTNATVALAPVYNALAIFDPMIAKETLETIRPELAESWSWSADRTALTFKLRQGVKWHDGRPFIAQDVKRTFDVVRGAAAERMKLNPRRAWYANVAEIVTNGDRAVTFRLKRPQPSLIAMLATGLAPVMAAHFPVADWRTKTLGTGPFVLKEYQRDKAVVLVKNLDYWAPGRPYLDGIRVNVVQARATQLAAYLAKQVEVVTPSAALKPFMDSIKKATDQVQFQEVTGTTNLYIMFNANRPPFNNSRLRLAMSSALDRVAYRKVVLGGSVATAGTMLPPPTGAWGLTPEQLVALPGYGNHQQNREEARRIMRELGYSPDKPLQAEILTNNVTFYVDAGAWTAGSLKEVYVDAKVKSLEPAVFLGNLSRREFQIVAYSGTNGSDDPDITFYEHYGCGSLRNYNDYCNPELQKKYDEQSAMFDNAARLKLVQEIDTKLVTDVARAFMGFRINYFPTWPYVKGFVAHQSSYNFWRMQEVWLDR